MARRGRRPPPRGAGASAGAAARAAARAGARAGAACLALLAFAACGPPARRPLGWPAAPCVAAFALAGRSPRCSARRRGRPAALGALRGGAQDADPLAAGGGALGSDVESDVESVLEPGWYVANANINLRSEASVDSDRAGASLKEGEFFEVNEVVLPAAAGGQAYLKVGDRGWAFHLGVAGEWRGRGIVQRATDEEAAEFRRLQADPEALEYYREIFEDAGAPGTMQSEDEAISEEVARLVTLENMQLWAQGASFAEISAAGPEDVACELSRMQADRRYGAALAALRTDIREMAGDAEFQRLLGAGGDGEEEDEAPPDEPYVAPRWMKLEGRRLERTAEEDGTVRPSPAIRPLPGAPESHRSRPTATGRRMGVRVPAAISFL